VSEQPIPHAIFFDVDGVLIQSLDIKGEGFAQTFSEFPDQHDEIVRLHLEHGGVTRSEKLKLIFQSVYGRGPTSEELDARLEIFSSCVLESVITAPEVCGASQALAHWSARTPLHAVSATPVAELVHILGLRGLTHFFTSIQGWPPPKPQLVQISLDRHSYDPARCVLIGDSREDFIAANSTGVHFIQVSRDPERDFIEADSVIRDLVGLSEAISSVLRPAID